MHPFGGVAEAGLMNGLVPFSCGIDIPLVGKRCLKREAAIINECGDQLNHTNFLERRCVGFVFGAVNKSETFSAGLAEFLWF